MTRARTVRTIAVLLGGLAASGCPRGHAAPAAPTPPPAAAPAAAPKGEWVAVRRGPLRRYYDAIGSLAPRRLAILGPQVAGRVVEVLVEEGDAVVTSQVLLRLDPVFFDIEVARAEAALGAADARLGAVAAGIASGEAGVEVQRALLAEADLDLGRMRGLWKKPAGETPSIPKQRYDDALLRRQQAAAGLALAQARLAEARVAEQEAAAGRLAAQAGRRYAGERRAEATIRAPWDGIVTRRLVDPGESVVSTPITELLELQDVATLELEFSLPQALAAAVASGTPVRFQVEGGADEYAGAVSLIYPTADPATRTVRCRVLVPNAGGALRPGYLARVQVLLREREDALLVPRLALARSGASWFAYVENDGHAVRSLVEVGLVAGEEAEVEAGLVVGDRVLVPEGADAGGGAGR